MGGVMGGCGSGPGVGLGRGGETGGSEGGSPTGSPGFSTRSGSEIGEFGICSSMLRRESEFVSTGDSRFHLTTVKQGPESSEI
jgi:hypothetical protein